jgi:hypothetical protein
LEIVNVTQRERVKNSVPISAVQTAIDRDERPTNITSNQWFNRDFPLGFQGG